MGQGAVVKGGSGMAMDDVWVESKTTMPCLGIVSVKGIRRLWLVCGHGLQDARRADTSRSHVASGSVRGCLTLP